MIAFLQSLLYRLKALLLAEAAFDLEVEFMSRRAAEKAELLRQAQQYDHDGLGEIARALRAEVQALSTEQPLASVLPGVAHLEGENAAFQRSALPLHQKSPGAKEPV